MNVPYGIFNVTLNKWVKDEDGKDYVSYDYFEAKASMERIDVISKANMTPKFHNNQFEIREKTLFI